MDFPFFIDSARNLVRAKKLEEFGGRGGDCCRSRSFWYIPSVPLLAQFARLNKAGGVI